MGEELDASRLRDGNTAHAVASRYRLRRRPLGQVVSGPPRRRSGWSAQLGRSPIHDAGRTLRSVRAAPGFRPAAALLAVALVGYGVGRWLRRTLRR